MLAFELSAEQRELKDTARRFAAQDMRPLAARHDEEQTFPEDVVRKAWELGLMNLEVPRELGGLGLGVLDTCLVLEELNYRLRRDDQRHRRQRPRRHAGDPRRERGAAKALPRTAHQRALVRGLLHYRAGSGLGRGRHVDDLPEG